MEALVNGQSSHPVQKPVVMDSNRVLDYATHPSLSVRLLGIVLVILIKFSIANWQLVKVRFKTFQKKQESFQNKYYDIELNIFNISVIIFTHQNHLCYVI